ncbi:YodC family protein [Jiella avicenniae]|uniref:DUF2158 domain-containing protein n=1 Tax=Jiella avicenniae TaxID=2907202 RepID=A0A9X1P879_9HYPH|nr:DUF2158 domain-containing protein [Jiella avicenniae]MCE7030966.1 DUF2158 domain-containing protein [Jiella avicenniae]
MADQVQVGDVVQLLSGGPSMTVEDIIQGPRAKCVWFAEDKLQTGVFAFALLKKVS